MELLAGYSYEHVHFPWKCSARLYSAHTVQGDASGRHQAYCTCADQLHCTHTRKGQSSQEASRTPCGRSRGHPGNPREKMWQSSKLLL